jgi:5-methylcytosine-specific restriction protein A
MANAPKKIVRSWKPERVEFDRPIDLSWFYNQWKWKKVSKAYRIANPLCECNNCKEKGLVRPAEVCDHKKGLKYLLDNGLDAFDWNELQSMSKECHNKKSSTERGGIGVKSR